MRKLLTILLFAAALCACSPKPLTIVHVNDTHSHFDALRSGEAGAIERAAYLDEVRARDGVDNVLTLHAGDFSQGSSYFTVLNGDLEIDVINAMAYDCITLGNHEFDNGIEELGRRLSRLQCPVVCANYDFSSFEAGKYVKPYAVLTKAGRRIGIIGLLTDISSVVSRATADRIPRLGADADIVNKWADYLRNTERCDLVIALTHIGYEEDCELAGATRGLDLIVGGHSHTFQEQVEYRTDLDGEQVPIVQDGCWGYYMGHLTVQGK